MKWLLGTYTSRFNRRHQLFGHLFSGRYKALIVDGSGSGYLGDKAFRKELLAQMSEQIGAEHYREDIREAAEEKAERLVSEQLKKARWTEEDLERQRKGHLKKIKMAQRRHTVRRNAIQ